MKKVNVLICFALSMVLFFSPVFVSAENMEYVENDSPYCVIDDSPTAISTYAAEAMTYTRMTYYSYQDTPDGEYYQNGAYSIGNRITAYYPDYTEIFFINDDGTLFSNPGTLSLLLFARGNELIITTYFEGGGSKDYYLDPKSYDGVISVLIENYEANIKSMRITLEDHNPGEFITPTSILSLDAFAYEIKEFTVFDLISDFFGDFFSNLSSKLKIVFSDFFVDLSHKNEFVSSKRRYDSVQTELSATVGSVNDISFQVDILDDASLIAAFGFISPILAGLFANIKFSVIFNVTCTIFIAVVALGFARHWKGR